MKEQKGSEEKTNKKTSASQQKHCLQQQPQQKQRAELHSPWLNHRLSQATAGTVHNAQKGPEAQRKELAMGCKKEASCEA